MQDGDTFGKPIVVSFKGLGSEKAIELIKKHNETSENKIIIADGYENAVDLVEKYLKALEATK